MNINYVKINSYKYDIVTANGSSIGEFVMMEDGFFYFFLTNYNGGAFDSRLLNELSNKLNELNKQWQNNIDEFFSKMEQTPVQIRQIVGQQPLG